MPYKDPENSREYFRKWRKENIEKARKAAREYARRQHQTNPEKQRCATHKWREENTETFLESNRKSARRWKKKNSSRVNDNENKRRAVKLKASVGDIPEDYFEQLIGFQDGRCVYCHLKIKLTVDHIVPLSRGGSHSWDNLVLACKRCNSSKHNKLLAEWGKYEAPAA